MGTALHEAPRRSFTGLRLMTLSYVGLGSGVFRIECPPGKPRSLQATSKSPIPYTTKSYFFVGSMLDPNMKFIGTLQASRFW